MRKISVLSLATLSACESLWAPYISTAQCDTAVYLCTDAGGFVDPAGSDAGATSACRLGHNDVTGKCRQIQPSNGIDPTWLSSGKDSLAPTQDMVIDTDLGTLNYGSGAIMPPDVIYHQTTPADCGGGWMVGIGVFSFTSIRIPEGVRVRVKGMRALALLSSGAIEIEGLLDLSGGAAYCSDPSCGGPGGFAGSTDVSPPRPGLGPGGGGYGYSVGGPGDEAGGGGGAGCGNGGKGDDAGPTYPAGLGGVAYMAATLVPLCGGSGGGDGGPANYIEDPGSRGGGGGGAVQLVSATTIQISSSAPMPSGIQAGGAGGQGDHAQTYDDGGGGGGAGGAILMEAPAITITQGAVLAANGGGGGGGFNNNLISTDGSPGLLSASPAPGGPGVRRGGFGGAGSGSSGENTPGPSGDGGAGGGGGAGRLRLNTLDGSVAISGTVSPAMGACASTGTLALQ